MDGELTQPMAKLSTFRGYIFSKKNSVRETLVYHIWVVVSDIFGMRVAQTPG